MRLCVYLLTMCVYACVCVSVCARSDFDGASAVVRICVYVLMCLPLRVCHMDLNVRVVKWGYVYTHRSLGYHQCQKAVLGSLDVNTHTHTYKHRSLGYHQCQEAVLGSQNTNTYRHTHTHIHTHTQIARLPSLPEGRSRLTEYKHTQTHTHIYTHIHTQIARLPSLPEGRSRLTEYKHTHIHTHTHTDRSAAVTARRPFKAHRIWQRGSGIFCSSCFRGDGAAWSACWAREKWGADTFQVYIQVICVCIYAQTLFKYTCR